MCYSALYDILRFFKVQGFALAHEVEQWGTVIPTVT